jgi:DNA ligase-4
MANARKERGEMKRSLQKLLRSTSALEQKWLIRIIMRDLKIGLSETSVLGVYHPDAVDLFTVCSSLEKVSRDLHSLQTHLNEASISLSTPFRPMLGQRASFDQITKLMDHQWFYIETKFDGDRMQLHKNGNKYMFFSRSSKDYTSSFGGSSLEGPFTPRIHNAFSSNVHQCIVDGEMVGWDPLTESYIPKGERVDVKALGEDEDVQQCFVAFDVLLVNGKNLANCPLQERVSYLDSLFTPVPGYLHLVDRRKGSSKEDVVRALNEAIDRREEGLVLKMPSGTYKPDKRKGSGWVKIKPEYVDSLSDQLDVLIIGGYYGSGHRAGIVSHFLCGVATPPDNPRDRPSVFHTFCKVGSGYTMSELRTLNQKLHGQWRPYDPKNPPPSIVVAQGGGSEKPNVWIEPTKSKIVQIRAAEIISSDKYKCGCTLRFPRLEKFRDDKEWYDCMTTDELEHLRQMASGHLAHQHYEGGVEGDAPPSKRKRTAVRVEMPRGVAVQFRHTDTSDVQETGSMFKGKEFCVVNGTSEMTKEKMERIIVEHGGTFVQHPGASTNCVVVGKMVQRAKNILQMGKHDMVKVEWFEQCLEEGRCVPFVPAHMVHTSPQTSEYFSQLYDRHGDSYTESVTEEKLVTIFSTISEKGTSHPVTSDEIGFIESHYFPNESPLGLFRQYR